MTMQEAIRLFNNYLHSNHKQRTIDSYVHVLGRFEMIHAQRDLDSIGSDEIYTFLEALTQDLAKLHSKTPICPVKILLQLHHRPLFSEHEKAL